MNHEASSPPSAKVVRTTLALALASALASCAPPGPAGDSGVDAGVPAFAEIQMIYTTNCSVGRSCHAANGRFPVLVTGMSHAATVGVMSMQIAMPMITPGNVERSYLWHKINGTMSTLAECRAMGADCGTRMPMVGGGELSAAQLDTFRRWIAAGAPSQ